jgi:hypothetical protein
MRPLLEELVAFARSKPELERADAVYLVRGASRGEVTPRSDVDLVVVLPSWTEGEEDAFLSSFERPVVEGESRVSTPKLARAEEWRAFESLYPAEFAKPTSVDARLLRGRDVLSAWHSDDAAFHEDLGDSLLRHTVTTLQVLSRMTLPDAPPRLAFAMRKCASRVVRAAVARAVGAYVPFAEDARALAARHLTADVRTIFARDAAPGDVRRALLALVDDAARDEAPALPAVVTVDEWRSRWLHGFGARSFVADDGEIVRTLLDEGHEVAVAPRPLIASMLRRTAAASAWSLELAGVDDVVRDARRLATHFQYNWRNKWIEWQGDDARRLALQLASVFDATLTLRAGLVLHQPADLRHVLHDACIDRAAWEVAEQFVLPALAGTVDAAPWRARLRTLAAALRPDDTPAARHLELVSSTMGKT